MPLPRSPRTTSPTPLPATPEPEIVEVETGALGNDGDATAHHPRTGRLIHIAGALPGERVIARLVQGGPAEMLRLVSRSETRVEPICALAAECGGCTLQHQAQPANLAWKADRVVQALEMAGFARPLMTAPIQADLDARRRMDLGVVRHPDGRVEIGLHRRHTRIVVDMVECRVLDPALFSLLAPLRHSLHSLRCLGRTGALLVNRLDDGADLLLRTDRAPEPDDRTRLAAFAAAHPISRIAWQHETPSRRVTPETVAQLAPTRTMFAGRSVDVPPGAFLQATVKTEAAIVAAVIGFLPAPMPSRSLIVELYAGCGTLTLKLASGGRVLAFEGDEAAARSLSRATGGMAVEVRRRDLARNPVDASEMRDAKAIVLDPPYGGAGRQIEQVARSGVATVIVVSCNPASLRREASVLRQAGYHLDGLTVLDQFLFSPRIESVAVFRRESSRRSRSGPSRSGCGR